MPRRIDGFFQAKDELRLYFESTLPDGEPLAHLALVHGYADHAGRYRLSADAWASMGLAVHAFDYRGHGQADGRRGHVTDWQEYLADLEQFWRRVLDQAGGKKCFLLGHSHGGLMGVHFVKGRKDMAGAILSAPYLGLALKPNPLQVMAARAIGRFVPILPQRLPIPPAQLTRDEVEQRKVAGDPLYNRTLTVGWFIESQKAQQAAVSMGPEIRLPIFMFCGEKDGVASSSTSRAFFETVASSDKVFKEYPGMLHEPLNEVGREQVWTDVFNWIKARI